jgi:hypothetical protein
VTLSFSSAVARHSKNVDEGAPFASTKDRSHSFAYFVGLEVKQEKNKKEEDGGQEKEKKKTNKASLVCRGRSNTFVQAFVQYQPQQRAWGPASSLIARGNNTTRPT